MVRLASIVSGVMGLATLAAPASAAFDVSVSFDFTAVGACVRRRKAVTA